METTPALKAAGSALHEGVAAVTRVLAGDPGIKPNTNGLPGLNVLQQMVGALLTWGLLACLAGLVISVMMWALAHHQGNYSQVSSGKTGVLVSAGGALLIGGANAIIGFFSTLGGGIR
jgi:hypothetical protein